MAMTAFAPAITRSKEIFAEKSSQVVLKLVPDLSDGKQADRKFFAIFVTAVGVIGLMFLLLINTLLAQDAFELTNLKVQAKKNSLRQFIPLLMAENILVATSLLY